MGKIVPFDRAEMRKRNAALRALWVEQMMFDASLPAQAFRVGCYIASRLDKNVDPLMAIVSRETIAERLGIAVRTVDDALLALTGRVAARRERSPDGVPQRHIEVTSGNGRGNANCYRPVLESLRSPAAFDEDESARNAAAFPEKRLQLPRERLQIYVRKAAAIRAPSLVSPLYLPKVDHYQPARARQRRQHRMRVHRATPTASRSAIADACSVTSRSGCEATRSST